MRNKDVQVGMRVQLRNTLQRGKTGTVIRKHFPRTIEVETDEPDFLGRRSWKVQAHNLQSIDN